LLRPQGIVLANNQLRVEVPITIRVSAYEPTYSTTDATLGKMSMQFTAVQ